MRLGGHEVVVGIEREGPARQSGEKAGKPKRNQLVAERSNAARFGRLFVLAYRQNPQPIAADRQCREDYRYEGVDVAGICSFLSDALVRLEAGDPIAPPELE